MSVLYGVNLSTFTRKVRLALLEKGVPYRLEPVAMGSPRAFALNPLGRIPVYEDAGAVIPDSSVIIAYLERVHPATPLYPVDAAGFANALWIEEYADTRLREATLPWFAERVVKPLFQHKPADEAALEQASVLRDATFGYLESRCVPGGYAAGTHFTVADVAVGAQLVTYAQGGGAVDPQRWPRLAELFGRLLARPSFASLHAEETATLDGARQRA